MNDMDDHTALMPENGTAPPAMAIPQPLAQALHDYLMTRPMREVEEMVVALRSLRAPE